MKVSRLMPGRRSRSSHGMSVMRPQPSRWQVGVALILGFRDRPGAPVGIDSHGPQSLHRDAEE